MDIVYNILVDFNKSVQRTVLIKKNDNRSRKLVFTLMENGKPYPLNAENHHVSLRAKTPNDSNVFAECEITKDENAEYQKAIYVLSDTITAQTGKTECEVTLYTSDDTYISSFSFYVQVESILFDENDLISEHDLRGFQQYLVAAEAAKKSAEESRDIAVENAEKVVEIAESLDGVAQETLEAAERAQTYSDNANSSMLEAQDKANAAQASAEAAAQTLEAAIAAGAEIDQKLPELKETVADAEKVSEELDEKSADVKEKATEAMTALFNAERDVLDAVDVVKTSSVTAVNQAQNDAISAIGSAETLAIANVESAEATAIANVNTASQTAITKADEASASAGSAATSEANASTSASNAATSEANARGYYEQAQALIGGAIGGEY